MSNAFLINFEFYATAFAIIMTSLVLVYLAIVRKTSIFVFIAFVLFMLGGMLRIRYGFEPVGSFISLSVSIPILVASILLLFEVFTEWKRRIS